MIVLEGNKIIVFLLDGTKIECDVEQGKNDIKDDLLIITK